MEVFFDTIVKMQNKHYLHALYVLTLLSASLLWKTPFIAFACLVATSTLLLQATKWKYTKVYIFCAIAGSASEMIAITAGAWHYANPQFAGIPIWLPLLWGSASILFMQLSEPLNSRRRGKGRSRKSSSHMRSTRAKV
jgi:hypothetical protein